MRVHALQLIDRHVRKNWRAIIYCLGGLLLCILWTVGATALPGLKVASGGTRGLEAPLTSALTTVATISAASIVLALSAALIGLQMLSRFGARASRMVVDQPVGHLIVGAAILGVGIPLWASVEPWKWLMVLGFACFSWGLLALAIASFITLSRLNPRWLTLHMLRRLFPLTSSPTEALFARLGQVQSTLLEISSGTSEADAGWRVTERAVLVVGLARHRVDVKRADLVRLIDTLASRTRSPTVMKGPTEEVASSLSLLALASNDSGVIMGTLKALRDIVQDAIQQRHPVRPALLDEVSGLVKDRLATLLDPAAIEWLVEQDPILSNDAIVVEIPDGQVVYSGRPDAPAVETIPDKINWHVVEGWLDRPTPPGRSEAGILAALLPRYGHGAESSGDELAEIVQAVTLDLQDAGIPEGDQASATGTPEEETKIAGPALGPDLGDSENEKLPPEKWAAIVGKRKRQSDAYDLLEEGVALLLSACAAPTPDDPTWPGGWRGVDALREDIDRLKAISLSQYESGRYAPMDRVERAIEDVGARIVRGRPSEISTEELPSASGWRVGERAFEHTTVQSATKALRELAIEAWHAGFGRRALFSIRRVAALFTVVVEKGDTKVAEDISEDLHISVIHTAKHTDDTLADRERSRQLVLGLAPDFRALGRAVQTNTDDDLWRQVFDALETVAWSPAGSELEAATEIYLHFLSGFGAASEMDRGRPWDAVAWERRPRCLPVGLPSAVREHLIRRLPLEATSDQPGMALVAVLALWRDVIVQDDPQTVREFRDVLAEHVLSEGRREFVLPTPWSPNEDDAGRAPQLEGPRIHWRLFDVADEAYRWACKKLEAGESEPPTLPSVSTPDADLRWLIDTAGAKSFVDEREYWGIDVGDDPIIYVQEADRSRRLLRDCQGRARSQFSWGYGGTGPHTLAAVLVADMLGNLAYCPSCFGTIGAGGGFVNCPLCDGDGLRRRDLWALHGACYNVTADLSKRVDPRLESFEGSPLAAQWRLTRIDFLQGAYAIVDQLKAEEEADSQSESNTLRDDA